MLRPLPVTANRSKHMDDFETLLQQIVEECLNAGVDPQRMLEYMRRTADEIEADIAAGAYAE